MEKKNPCFLRSKGSKNEKHKDKQNSSNRAADGGGDRVWASNQTYMATRK